MGAVKADRQQSMSSSSSAPSASTAICLDALPNKALVIVAQSQLSNSTNPAAVSIVIANICGNSDKPKSESTSSATSATP